MGVTRRGLPVVLAALLLGSAVGAVCDESLADAAAREKARREAERAKGQASRTFTDDDLKGGPTKPKEAGGAAVSSEGASSPSAEQTVSEWGTWKSRVRTNRDAVGGIEAKIAKLNQKIGELRADNGLGRTTAVNRDREIQQEITAALKEITDLEKDLAQARERLDDTLEQARRAGVPAGELESSDTASPERATSPN